MVVIKAARNLVLADKQNATSNPFCRVGFCEGEDEIASKGKVRGWISTTLNSQPKLQQVHETQVVPRSLHPIYGGPNNTFALDPPLHPATGQMLQLRVEVWSKEKLGRDLFMGQVVLPPNQYATAASERWLPLCGRPGKNDFVTGEILISITPPASVLSSRRYILVLVCAHVASWCRRVDSIVFDKGRISRSREWLMDRNASMCESVVWYLVCSMSL